MGIRGKKIITCTPRSDVTALTVGPADIGQGVVALGVYDADSEDSSDAVALTTAQLLPSQAIRLARALLVAAGVSGVIHDNGTSYTFID